jgi:predicted transcriptional regulator
MNLPSSARVVVSGARKAGFEPVLGRANGRALTVFVGISRLDPMVVHLKPETESRLKELCASTGRDPDELVEDAMAGYLAELAQTRKMLDGRYDEIKSGLVKPIDEENAFGRLRTKSENRRRP